MKIEFEILKRHFGTHTAAAKAIGISPRRYREWRSGKIDELPIRASVVKTLADMIMPPRRV
jgi:hypothetical protein